jgi:hypothetical protein
MLSKRWRITSSKKCFSQRPVDLWFCIVAKVVVHCKKLVLMDCINGSIDYTKNIHLSFGAK